MKLTCTQENFNKGLAIVNHLAIKNTNLPILSNVLIKTYEGGFILSSTNLEIGISSKVRAKIEKDGLFTVPANLITNFISLLNTDENINLELIGKEIIIKTDQQETKIKGEDASEFPIIPEVEKDKKIVIKKNDLKNSLSKVVFAASLDETRIEISGVLFNINKKELTLVATDSYRLAESVIPCQNEENIEQVIVPQKTAQEVLRVLALVEEDEVEIYFSENQILFIIGSTEINSRLIEGNYPDYKQIIPEQEKTSVFIKKDKLTKLVKRAALFSRIGINDVNLEFDTDNQKIIIKAVSNQTGENFSQQEAVINGENNNIVFNYRYLLDGLNSIESEMVIIKTIDNSSPGVFKGENEEGYLYIIMPIKQ
ncbi:MAG: DNA polymerase III subunit beta [Patescibacteria group bacterium]